MEIEITEGVLIALIICCFFGTIAYLIYADAQNDSPFEICMNGCFSSYDNSAENICKLKCIETFQNETIWVRIK